MANLFNTEQLKAVLKGGAKADRFSLKIPQPKGLSTLIPQDQIILVKSVIFPEKAIGTAPVWIAGGRVLHIPSNVEFGANEVRMTAYNTPTHDFREVMFKWMSELDRYSDNFQTTNPWELTTKITVSQVGTGNAEDAPLLKDYVLCNAFPRRVGEIQMDAESINRVTTFDLVFTFSHIEGE